MLRIGVLLWLVFIFFAAFGCVGLRADTAFAQDPPLLILDTDISSDVDDVGAVAILHRLASQGHIRILAMMVSSGDPWSVPCLDAINTWYGRPDIPLGMVKGKAVTHKSKYTRKITKEFSHDSPSGKESPGAVALYRKILAQQADQSITLVTIGYLTNLRNLLLSAPDAASSLDGRALVGRKIKTLVCMGGEYPTGYEWNFYQDGAAAAYVVERWPSPVIFVGFESGRDIWTGIKLKKSRQPNPIRRSFELYNNFSGRPSWDQVAVYYAVQVANGWRTDLWSRVQGRNSVQLSGRNSWYSNEKDHACHSYILQQGDSGEIAQLLEQLMLPASP